MLCPPEHCLSAKVGGMLCPPKHCLSAKVGGMSVSECAGVHVHGERARDAKLRRDLKTIND